MQSPYFNNNHQLFRDSVRSFINTEVAPNANAWENEGRIPRSIWLKLGELDFLGINIAQKYGGMEADFFYSVIFLEEIARSNMAGFAAAVGVHEYMSIAHIAKVGSDYLKETYLKAAIKGQKIGALAISEPEAGSDVANIKTTAIKQGEHYIINGSKIFITNGVYSDFVVVACKTDPSAGSAGISLIVVDHNTLGFSAKALDKLGWRSSDTGELFFDDVKVPVTNLVGTENMGFYYIMDSFQLERLVAAIGNIGACLYGMEITLKYIQEREAFGRKIAKFQTIRHELVQLATEIEAAQHLTYYASWLYNNNHFGVKECSMAKLLSSEIAKKAADTYLQCFGGNGFMEDFPMARMYRDVRAGTIVGGTSAIMREILSKIIIDNVHYQSAYNNTNKPNKQDIPEQTLINKPIKQFKTMSSTPETAREIIKSLETRFKAEKAPAGYSTLMHFNISGTNGGEFTVKVENGACSVTEGLEGTPKCTVSSSDTTYQGVELGKDNPQMAVMMGKIKVSNIGEMMTFVNLFQKLY